jgi:LmbE family N-acetylglucosaminyl deacetylase
MTPAGDVLAIFAHPDDESLLAGGTLAASAAAGLDVTIVSLTHGEAGPIGDRSVGRERLGEVREQELRDAARELGAARARCLDYPDGQLDSQPERRVAGELAALIESSRPTIVLSFGSEGLYWHEDHIAVHSFVRAALELAGVEPPPELYEATVPKGRMSELAAAMTARGLPADVWGLAPDAFGAPRGAIDTVVDVGPFVEAKLRALRCHRTQLGPGQLLAELPDDLATRFLGTEYFIGGRGSQSRLARVVADAIRTRAASGR